jgi:YVTN family beta-propeller protein
VASASTIVNTIPVGAGPIAVSSDGIHVWVANYGDGTVTEIDASTGTVVNVITVGSSPEGVTGGNASSALT